MLQEALATTAKNRGTTELLPQANQILFEVEQSIIMKDLWKRYQKRYSYAEDISWDDIATALTAVACKAGSGI